MKRPPIRTLSVAGSPAEIGRAHGAAHGPEIRRYCEDRVSLVTDGAWSGGPIPRTEVIAVAESMLDAHRSFDADLADEMEAMADAAGISTAEAIIVGGFTDFVDTVRAVHGGPLPTTVQEDDCTAVVVPSGRAAGSPILGQTWDMHDSATEHVLLLRLEPEGRPPALVFTTTGCLGQIGMNAAGVCVGINNLVCTDGRPGVTWPTVVRAMLGAESADEALGVLRSADLAGAHNFTILDASGAGYSVEAMPTVSHVFELGTEPLVHTNHTLAESTSAVQASKDAGLLASSEIRLKTATELLVGGNIDVDRVIALTREPDAICQVAADPFHIESSGAAVMSAATGEMWACWGRPAENEFHRFAFEAHR